MENFNKYVVNQAIKLGAMCFFATFVIFLADEWLCSNQVFDGIALSAMLGGIFALCAFIGYGIAYQIDCAILRCVKSATTYWSRPFVQQWLGLLLSIATLVAVALLLQAP